jgi:hypothetical protein
MQPLPSRVFSRILGLAALVVALTGTLGRADDALDEFTKEVAQYELTMPLLEAYGAVMSDLADWAKANPEQAAEMNQRTPRGPTSFKETMAHLESEPVIAESLKKNQLTGRDFVLIPTVLMQAQIAAMGEAQGRSFPADRINPKNPALIRDHEKRVGEIMTKLNADRARLAGR